jgi:hypothetical protein
MERLRPLVPSAYRLGCQSCMHDVWNLTRFLHSNVLKQSVRVGSPYDFLRVWPGLPEDPDRAWWWCGLGCCFSHALLLTSLPAAVVAGPAVAAVSVLRVLLLTDSALPAALFAAAAAAGPSPASAAAAASAAAVSGSCLAGAPAPEATGLGCGSASFSRSPAEGLRRITGRLASAAMAYVAARFMSSLTALQGHTDRGAH